MLTRIERFRPYLDHGILELDNNAVERGMRAIAVGRKNFLFVGIDPIAWLANTIARILDYKVTKVDEMLPMALEQIALRPDAYRNSAPILLRLCCFHGGSANANSLPEVAGYTDIVRFFGCGDRI
ncbi:MAG: family transposase [Cypionkella sp.]|nr:family transposase [Cypionkella sp.]